MTRVQYAFLTHVGALVNAIRDNPEATTSELRECQKALSTIVAQARLCGLDNRTIANAMNLPLSQIVRGSNAYHSA